MSIWVLYFSFAQKAVKRLGFRHNKQTALGYPRNQCLCYHRNRLVSLPCPDPYQYIDYFMPDWSPAPTRPYVIIGVTGPLPLPGPRSSWERLVPFPHHVLDHPRKDWSPCPWSSKVPGLEILKEGWSTSTLVTQCDTGPPLLESILWYCV